MTAPPNTPHLCAVLNSSYNNFFKFVKGLEHYSALAPGAEVSSCANAQGLHM